MYGAYSAERADYIGLFDKMDVDSEGKIDYGEFIVAATNWEKLMSKKNIDIAFRMFDKNGDGSISILELQQVFNNKSLD